MCIPREKLLLCSHSPGHAFSQNLHVNSGELHDPNDVLSPYVLLLIFPLLLLLNYIDNHLLN